MIRHLKTRERSTSEKLEKLKEIILSYESVLVAFSGGADSALVLKVAHSILGNVHLKAVTAKSESLPASEVQEVNHFVTRYDIPHLWIETNEIKNPNYASNPKNRCYFCKIELYEHLVPLAVEYHLKTIVNGANLDDLGDWRPGLEAARENNIRSPLIEADITKPDVREISRSLGIPTWDKPQAACLASRIAYGEEVTPAKLKQIEMAEEVLKKKGFRMVRVRYHENHASVEVGEDEVERILADATFSERICSEIQELGFHSVRIDPVGYEQGKLNRMKS